MYEPDLVIDEGNLKKYRCLYRNVHGEPREISLEKHSGLAHYFLSIGNRVLTAYPEDLIALKEFLNHSPIDDPQTTKEEKK